MKSKTIILCLILLGEVTFAQHDHSAGHSTTPAHKKKETAHSHRARPEFQLQLQQVFIASLQLNEALVSSNAANASASINEVKAAISKVDVNLLRDEALMDWLTYLKTFNENLDIISSSTDLATQRKAFLLFTDSLSKSLKTFGTGGLGIYQGHCPMANNNEGAHWLSLSKEIRNPYFGEEMLSCGKIKEVIR